MTDDQIIRHLKDQDELPYDGEESYRYYSDDEILEVELTGDDTESYFLSEDDELSLQIDDNLDQLQEYYKSLQLQEYNESLK